MTDPLLRDDCGTEPDPQGAAVQLPQAAHRWQRPAHYWERGRRDLGWSRCQVCGLQRRDVRGSGGREYRWPDRRGWPYPTHGEQFRAHKEPPCRGREEPPDAV